MRVKEAGEQMTRTAIALFAASLVLGGYSGTGFAAQPPGPPPPGYDNRGAWDAPPNEYRADIQRRGFRDGIEGARKDFQNHRSPDVNRRDEFRHPQGVPGPLRDQYREAFRHGYDVAVRRMTEHREEWDRH
jgi:hypothetical protein